MPTLANVSSNNVTPVRRRFLTPSSVTPTRRLPTRRPAIVANANAYLADAMARTAGEDFPPIYIARDFDEDGDIRVPLRPYIRGVRDYALRSWITKPVGFTQGRIGSLELVPWPMENYERILPSELTNYRRTHNFNINCFCTDARTGQPQDAVFRVCLNYQAGQFVAICANGSSGCKFFAPLEKAFTYFGTPLRGYPLRDTPLPSHDFVEAIRSELAEEAEVRAQLIGPGPLPELPHRRHQRQQRPQPSASNADQSYPLLRARALGSGNRRASAPSAAQTAPSASTGPVRTARVIRRSSPFSQLERIQPNNYRENRDCISMFFELDQHGTGGISSIEFKRHIVVCTACGNFMTRHAQGSHLCSGQRS
ncbi:hypothetical protein BDZ89DRAFT_1148946 [Hymenopellis radicata]|nr:hypothetical protein BDZ89DRAFT_1148946 [Hymenopellis radicata]